MPHLSSHLFWDVRAEEIDYFEKHAAWLARRVLEYGDWPDWQQLVVYYGKGRLAGIVTGIRMWSLQDVGAMKLNAISNRGSKKDFYDLATQLDHFTLQTLIGHYQSKYRPASLMMVIRSLA